MATGSQTTSSYRGFASAPGAVLTRGVQSLGVESQCGGKIPVALYQGRNGYL
jgi:hypothetical protein